MTRAMKLEPHRTAAPSALLAVAVVLTSCGWRGIANVPLPGGPGHRARTR